MMDFYVKIRNPAVDFSLVRKKTVAQTKNLNQGRSLAAAVMVAVTAGLRGQQHYHYAHHTGAVPR
jgi:hypothetical protein